MTKYPGVFRISCEVTLQLLRDNKDSLMSVLDAFVHDPLVEWEDEKRKLVHCLIFHCPWCKDIQYGPPLGSGYVTKRSEYKCKFLQTQGGHAGTCEICAKSNREKAQGNIFTKKFSQSY